MPNYICEGDHEFVTGKFELEFRKVFEKSPRNKNIKAEHLKDPAFTEAYICIKYRKLNTIQ